MHITLRVLRYRRYREYLDRHSFRKIPLYQKIFHILAFLDTCSFFPLDPVYHDREKICPVLRDIISGHRDFSRRRHRIITGKQDRRLRQFERIGRQGLIIGTVGLIVIRDERYVRTQTDIEDILSNPGSLHPDLQP